jgi:cell division topological specificity factor
MFENVINFFKKIGKKDQIEAKSKDTAKERLHLVLMQDRANVSADFLDMMRQEIIEVIKKYIDVDEKDIDVRLTNKTNEDGTTGAPALYANIPIAGIREEMKKEKNIEKETKEKKQENVKKEDKTEEDKNSKKAVEEKASDENNEEVVKDDSKDEELDESTVDTSDDDESVDDESEKSDAENEDNKSENDDSEDDNEELDETDDSEDSEEVKEKVSANKSNEE